MKLVRKVDRKRYHGKAVYEYERILVPIPSENRDLVRPWLGRDLKIHIEPLSYGFAVLVTAERKYIDGFLHSLKFEMLMKQMEPDSGGRTDTR